MIFWACVAIALLVVLLAVVLAVAVKNEEAAYVWRRRYLDLREQLATQTRSSYPRAYLEKQTYEVACDCGTCQYVRSLRHPGA